MAAEARFPIMGTTGHVTVVGDPELVEVAHRRLTELEARWSRFIPTSEISALNRAAGQTVTVSPETALLVELAVHAWRETGGRFDPTVLGDVIRAGYDRTITAVVVRPGRGVSLLRRGCDEIIVDPTTGAVTLPADVGFDPGGIGKGLAADLVATELLELGADGVCINLGGDLRAAGVGPDLNRWVIDVEHPQRPEEVVRLAIADGAIATSTVARRRWEIDGEVHHHLIDPETGAPSQADTISATAVTGMAWRAEVVAKAALLDPASQPLVVLNECGAEGLAVGTDGITHRTEGLARFLVQPEPTLAGASS